ncbi:MAG: amino acid transporter [Myxococcaceae bacterium]|nr:amino acid transporter [Myxococcaceae bacterium]
MTALALESAPQKHPKGLKWLFLTEMWERFSFYLMIGILYLYLVDSQKGGMGWDGKKAAGVVGSYLALVYFTPFIGGIIADRLLGMRKTVIIGGILMAIGHVLLAFPSEMMLYLALLALVLGNGCFKPNISTLVGNLYPKDSPLRDAGYNIFYMGINLGAFVCNFVAAIVRNKWGWHAAFATAGVGMVFGLIIFIIGQKDFAHADVNPKENKDRESLTPLWVRCIGPAAVFGIAGWVLGGMGETGKGFLGLGSATTAFLFACAPVIYFFVWIRGTLKDPQERSRTSALLVIYLVVVTFWAIFHQNATALSEWASSNTDRTPNALVQPIVNLAPDFAETAPPGYYKNASPQTARPEPRMFEVVSDEAYLQLEKDKKLNVEEGKPTQVTQKMFDGIYANAGAERVPDHLRLVNAELFQSINAGFVILFTPLVVGVFAFLRRKKKEPSTSAKIGLGLFVTGCSALVMLAAVMATNDANPKAGAWWLFGVYGVVTIGELLLSPMGLSLANKLAPKSIRAFMMGGWFLSTSIGNKVSGLFGEVYHSWDHKVFFLVNALAVFGSAAAIFLLLPWLRRQMGEETVHPPAVVVPAEPVA